MWNIFDSRYYLSALKEDKQHVAHMRPIFFVGASKRFGVLASRHGPIVRGHSG